MPTVSFINLLNVYRHTTFDPSGDGGLLRIATSSVLADIQLIESTDTNASDANISVLDEPLNLAVGQEVRVRVSAPKLALGILAKDFDGLLNAPGARLEQCNNFYVVSVNLGSDDTANSDIFTRYIKTLEFYNLAAEACAYVDKTKQELIFVKKGKFSIPVYYNESSLLSLDIEKLKSIIEFFKDDGHRDQKLEIFSEALIDLAQGQPLRKRFAFIMENISALVDEVQKGYKLFVSTFSYTKIRGDLEATKLTYVNQIHKSLVDIQSQLLGIPVATIIVATQLKPATTCDINLWIDVAVLFGAWAFFALLAMSITNQWVTLLAIREDVTRQREKLLREFEAISGQFVDIFDSLLRRIRWHRAALIGVGTVAMIGCVFATAAYIHLTNPSMTICFAS